MKIERGEQTHQTNADQRADMNRGKEETVGEWGAGVSILCSCEVGIFTAFYR